MLLVLMNCTLIHLLHAVVNNVLLYKVLMWCHTLLLQACMSSVVPQRSFSTEFAANFYPLDESSLGGTSLSISAVNAIWYVLNRKTMEFKSCCIVRPTISVSFKESPLLERYEPSKTAIVLAVLLELLKTA